MNTPAPFRRRHDFQGRAALSPARRAAIANQRPIIARVARRGEDTVALPALGLLALVWMLAVAGASAATVLSGNVSGTWTTNGSPYILSADCTVPSNQALTIEPGVIVIISPGVTMRADGAIAAVGAPSQPISIQGLNATNYWNSIYVSHVGLTNRFHYCRFRDAYQALIPYVQGSNQIMNIEILNCEFVNCRESAVICEATGFGPGATFPGSATLNAEIHNCVFEAGGNGCYLSAAYVTGTSTPGDAYQNSRITGNIFKNLQGAALLMQASGNQFFSTNPSQPYFINNTVVNVRQGVVTVSPSFEPIIRNNLFAVNSNAVSRFGGGSGGLDANYNCFWSNRMNFVGYPGVYGVPVQNNHNGDPCDAFFNIFLNPQFLDTNQFLLSNFSPCIDAGDPAIADVCPQLSRGSAISDIGAYGGPDACGWLTHGFAPVITGPPSAQSSCVGGGAAFQVAAQGSTPLNYRWYFNTNTLLAGETNGQLNLANLQTNQAGLYSVTVSNAFGSVTSAPARLLVFDACVGINLYAGLSITGIVGRTYVVDVSTNFAGPNWIPFATNTFTQSRWLLIDTNTPFTPARFFRVRLLP